MHASVRLFTRAPAVRVRACGGWRAGGPLIHARNGPEFFLVGFPVPFGGCGSPQFPGVYVRATAFAEWAATVVGVPLNTPGLLWKGRQGRQVVNMALASTSLVAVSMRA